MYGHEHHEPSLRIERQRDDSWVPAFVVYCRSCHIRKLRTNIPTPYYIY